MDDAVAIARRGFEAFNTGDWQALLELLDEDVEAYVPPELPNSGLFSGREGFLEMLRGWDEAWERFEVEPLGFSERGDKLVVAVIQRGVGRGSGLAVEQRFNYVFEVRDGKLMRWSLEPA
jgi:ketosteroid isomerase-like protein